MGRFRLMKQKGSASARSSLDGFTLIELLVVISIIGLLASVVLVSLNSARSKARAVRRKSDLVQVQKALELYYNDKNVYPSTSGNWWGVCPAYGAKTDSGATAWIPELTPTYMSRLPRDPDTGKTNSAAGWPGCQTSGDYSCYLYASNGVDYKLLAHCTPETYSSTDTFYDPRRPNWAWQVSTPDAYETY